MIAVFVESLGWKWFF